jgi:hypothetical protein
VYNARQVKRHVNHVFQVGYMNDAIRTATESFKDEKIQYVDFDPAFQGHRFCEPGSTDLDQFNNNNNLWIWNQPTRFLITITQGTEVKEYNRGEGVLIQTFPPKDLYDTLIAHQDGPVTQDGDYKTAYYRDPTNPSTKMTIKVKTKNGVDVLNGSKSRTLHPTQPGHTAMGDIIVERLKQVMQGSTGPVVLPPLCPSGCTCNGAVPLCP